MKKASLDGYEPFNLLEEKCPICPEKIQKLFDKFSGHRKKNAHVYFEKRITEIYTTYRVYEQLTGKPTGPQRKKEWENIQIKAEALLDALRWNFGCENLIDFSQALELDLKEVATREERRNLISAFNEIRGLVYFAKKVCENLENIGPQARNKRRLPDNNWDWMLNEIKKLYIAIYNKEYGSIDYIKEVLIEMGFQKDAVKGISKRLERRKNSTK